MKNKFLLMVICLFFLIISSCNFSNENMNNYISPPENNKIPIEGEWKIYKYSIGRVNNNDDFLESDGIAIFCKDVALIEKIYCKNPNYSIKVVDTKEYLVYKYKITPEDLEIQNKKIQVITITSENQYFIELLKINDSKLILDINNNFYCLNKISDHVSIKKLNELWEKNNKDINFDIETKNNKASAFLIGMSYKLNDSEDIKYKTLFIKYDNNMVKNAMQINDFIFPRKSGFWKLYRKNDEIVAYPVDKYEKTFKEIKCYFGNGNLKRIIFLGNDYLSVEIKSNNNLCYRVFPIDAMETLNPIRIRDLFGEDGKNIFQEAIKNSSIVYDIDNKIDESNFTLIRRSGHWIVNGRVNNKIVSDFNLAIIPPKKLVLYDELSINWSEVKLKIPDAVDAFTSPNENVAVILTKKEIQIYEVKNRQLSIEPIKKIKLENKSEVIMAEWAIGQYVEKWENEFIKNGGEKVN